MTKYHRLGNLDLLNLLKPSPSYGGHMSKNKIQHNSVSGEASLPGVPKKKGKKETRRLVGWGGGGERWT